MFLVAASLFVITASVNLQVPLYTAYAEAAGRGVGATALAFSAYLAGLLPMLVLLGGLSDRVGRKPVLLGAVACAFLATLAMILRPALDTLIAARVLQGIGVGLSMGAGTAYLAEIYPSLPHRVAVAVALSSALGFGSGALLTAGLLVPFPSLRPPSYGLVLMLAASALAAAVLGLPRLGASGGALLRPPLYPPRTGVAQWAIALAWSVSGLVIAVVPSELRQHGAELWSGPALFLVNACGAAVQPVARRWGSRRALLAGCATLPCGYTLVIAGAWTGRIPLVLLGSAVAGSACYGFTYLGGLAKVVEASGRQTARAASGYFLSAYLGFCLPSILVGYAADVVGIPLALAAFGLPVGIGSAAVALTLLRGKSQTERPDPLFESPASG
jgi:hypothetical protein